MSKKLDGIKQKIASTVMLRILEFETSFEVQTKASDYASGGVLLHSFWR